MKKLTNEALENCHHYLNDFELVDRAQFMKRYPFTEQFLKNVNRFRECAVVLKRKEDVYDGNTRYLMVYHTDNYRYTIIFTGDYIGGGYGCRRMDPFEDWTRGGDLTDGHEGEVTFNKIILDILSVEGKAYGDY